MKLLINRNDWTLCFLIFLYTALLEKLKEEHEMLKETTLSEKDRIITELHEQQEVLSQNLKTSEGEKMQLESTVQGFKTQVERLSYQYQTCQNQLQVSMWLSLHRKKKLLEEEEGRYYNFGNNFMNSRKVVSSSLWKIPNEKYWLYKDCINFIPLWEVTSLWVLCLGELKCARHCHFMRKVEYSSSHLW